MTPRNETRSRSTSVWSARLGLIAVLCFFCLPLFVGLRGWDLRNDEALYTHAIDRILETGDWLTPRLPGDVPFLEKPPLKFWIVAAGIRSGLLPNDEFGIRFFDALFGAIAFVYVFFVGRLLAGSLCGIVAVLILFTIDPLLFFHGLRENNMEAPLFLAYCGGVYHFARWAEESSRRRRLLHALAVGAYFTLGFMTKYVAVLFLPVMCAIAFMWRESAVARVRAQWREWIPATLCVLVATAPWFIYQTVRSGSLLWQTMFGQHVYVRFTSFLDPRHLEPWHYYYSELWQELTFSGSVWISAAGALILAYQAWTGRPWLARLVFVWWIVPFALMSIGTSKMIHYTYPFLPAIALGAGLAADALFRAINRGGAPGFKGGRAMSAVMACAVVAVLLPLSAYPRAIERARSVARPLATMRDCMLTLNAPSPQTHVYPTRISHSYYYYLRRVGPWVEHYGSPKDDEWQSRLSVPGEQSIMILLRSDYQRFTEQIDNATRRPAGFALSDDIEEVVVTPKPFEACAVATVAIGAPGIGSLAGYSR